MPERPPDSGAFHSPETPPRTRAAEMAREGRKFFQFFRDLPLDKFLAFGLAFTVLFVCSLAGYIIWKWVDSQRDRESLFMRVSESREELLRLHCASESKESRIAHAANLKEVIAANAAERKERAKTETDRDTARMKFEADERDKDRKAMALVGVEFGKLREAILLMKKPEEECAPLGRAIAPFPKVKIVP